ncbi:DHH family phosphoesterase, partial [Vibrio metschnikovii]|nr:DHH family phosphoesterase [Vibrio metschnikovii]
MHYDVFNGDADGIIALLQLRLAEPIESQLVTGVKRDIQLLKKLTVNPGDSLTVLDISMAKNAFDLQRLLSEGASVFYA